jgi:uroporphyrinogen III methyltransferase/synthase
VSTDRPQQSKGIVYLVGAGPGDPGLITVRGARLLERADVVVYDYLSSEKLLKYCPRAEQIYVGKNAATHTMTQDRINALLVEQGRAGKRVVRLKGGDPFVFGRGGEEAEALHAAGVPFEAVPGITSSIGGLAYAGIPVTHRDFNSSFTLITGHEKEEAYRDEQAKARGAAAGSSDIDWSAIARLPAVAFYMGVKSLPRITERLIANGKDPNTPAATVQWLATNRQRVVVGTVKDIYEKVTEAGISSPAITVVGKIVSLRPMMNWFERRPLFGKTVVVTRTRQQASELSDRLEELGADVIEAPTIEVAEPESWAEVDRALDEAHGYDWVVFTSRNGVEAVKRRLVETGRDVRAFGRARFAAIGNATADAIRQELCVKVDVCPQQFVAEALAEELIRTGDVRGKKFLLLRAEIARPVLVDRLNAGGAAEVRDVSVYETRPAASLPAGLAERVRDGNVDWVTFSSSSTAKNFFALLGDGARESLANVKIASIGPVTSTALRELGVRVDVEAKRSDIGGLADAVVEAAGAR